MLKGQVLKSQVLKSQVIIIGGGVAGIACARALQDANIDYLLIERGEKLGGRLKSDHANGYIFDHGFQVFLSCYAVTKGLLSNDINLCSFASGAIINILGNTHTIADPFRDPRLSIATLNAPIGNCFDKALMLKLKVIAAMSSSGSRSDAFEFTGRGRRILVKVINSILRHAVVSPKDKTTEEYLRLLGFSRLIIDSFFRPFLGGIFLDPSLSTSAEIFLQVFGNFSKGTAQLPDGGMETVATSLSAPLDKNKVLLNQRVVNFTSDKVVLESGEVLQTRSVVSALDADSLRFIKPYLELPQTRSVSCFYFSSDPMPELGKYLVLNGTPADGEMLDTKICTTPGESFGEPCKSALKYRLINNIAPLSNVNPSYAPRGRLNLSVSVLGEYLDELSVSSELHKIFPGRKFDFLRRYLIKGSLPDQSHTINSRLYSNLDDSDLIVCGDFLSSDSTGSNQPSPAPQLTWPLAASIETAVKSGLRAAQRIKALYQNP